MGEYQRYFTSRNNNYDYKIIDGDGKFRKNKTVLLNEATEGVSEKEFKELIRQEIIKNIFPIDNIVLLAGAGASIISDAEGNPDENFGHTIDMLAKAIDKDLAENNNIFSIEEMSERCNYRIPIKIKNSDGKEAKYNSEFVLEDFLSKVLIFEEYIREGEEKSKYIATKDRILEMIVEKTSYSFDPEKHKHDSIINILSNMIRTPERLSVITTNYDTLFEEAAEYLEYTIFDGFSFSSNPKFNVDLFDWSLVKPIFNVKSDKVEYKKRTINLLKIHGSLTWKVDGEEIVRGGKITNLDKEIPLMIFPSSNKYTHSYEKPYFELFSKFQELLKKPNTLLITSGFSFADNHIAKMISQAIKTSASLTLLVTDYNIESEGKNLNWGKLEQMMDSGYRVFFLKATLDQDLIDYFGGRLNDN